MQGYLTYSDFEFNGLQLKIYQGLTGKVGDDFNNFLEDIIESALENLNDCLAVALNYIKSPAVCIKLNCLGMIEYILENNEKDLGQNLKILATTLTDLFKSENELNIRISILSCIKVLIISAKQSISPYYSEILCCSHYLLSTARETLSIRCLVLCVLGHLFSACPASYSFGLIDDFTERTFKYLESGCSESRSAAFTVFSCLLPKFHKETEKYADMLIDEIISSGEMSVDSSYEDADAKGYFEIEIDELLVPDNYINEKCSAVKLIGKLVKAFPHKVFIRIQEIEEFIDASIELNQDTIYQECIQTSYKVLVSSFKSSKSYFTKYWHKKMLKKYLEILETESSVYVVNKVIKVLTKLIENLGQTLIPNKNLKSVFESVSVLINIKAECQERNPETQSYLLDILSSLIYQLAVTWNADSFPFIEPIISQIITHPFHEVSPSQSSGLIAALAEQIQIYPRLSKTHYTGILNIIENIINKQQDYLYWNTVYLIGVLCENEGNFNGCYEYFLNFISGLLACETSPGLCDNIAAALCRMVIGCHTAVPMVYNEKLLQLLPIKEDFNEVKCMFKYISFVLDHQKTNLPKKFTEVVVESVKSYENSLEIYEISFSHYEKAVKYLKSQHLN